MVLDFVLCFDQLPGLGLIAGIHRHFDAPCVVRVGDRYGSDPTVSGHFSGSHSITYLIGILVRSSPSCGQSFDCFAVAVRAIYIFLKLWFIVG